MLHTFSKFLKYIFNFKYLLLSLLIVNQFIPVIPQLSIASIDTVYAGLSATLSPNPITAGANGNVTYSVTAPHSFGTSVSNTDVQNLITIKLDGATTLQNLYNVTGAAGQSSTTIPITIPAGTSVGTHTLDFSNRTIGGSLNPADMFSINITIAPPDTTPPNVTINQFATQADPTNTGPLQYTVTFSEPVDNLALSDFVLSGTGTGGSVSAMTPNTSSGTTWTISVTPGLQGSYTLSLPANSATDAAGNGNTISSSTDNTIFYDIRKPDPTIEQAAGQLDPTKTGPINFTLTFTESINPTTLTVSDLVLTGTGTGGSISALTPVGPSNNTWTVQVTPGTTGTYILNLPSKYY